MQKQNCRRLFPFVFEKQFSQKMENSPSEDDLLDEDSSEFFINFPPEVQKAIDEVSFPLT